MNEPMTKCSACNTIQRLSSTKQTAKLLIVWKYQNLTSKALRVITNTQKDSSDTQATVAVVDSPTDIAMDKQAYYDFVCQPVERNDGYNADTVATTQDVTLLALLTLSCKQILDGKNM